MPVPQTERLIIFTRFPEPGTTKTRLIPALGAEGAADLQRRMTERMFRVASGLQTKRSLNLEVRYEGGSREKVRAWLGADVELSAQKGGPLDQRMLEAFEAAFGAGCRRVVIIGTDIPGITDAIIDDAFEQLHRKDLVLGPATDGGYYLIGLRHSAIKSARPLLSDAVAWGTDKVLQTSLEIADDCGLSYSLLAALTDIDRPEDLPVWQENFSSTSDMGADQKISVIVPAVDEIDNIEATLLPLQDAGSVEVILVDGGSRDGTPEIARQLGAEVLQSDRGRATQMNAGAAAATGDILLFLHADTRLPPGFDGHVRRVVAKPGNSAGAFVLRIDSPDFRLRVMEWGANMRARYTQIPFGDQAIFVSAALFRQVGGFPDLPIMEDFEFIRRLKKRGRIEIVPDAVYTSARRWHSMGIWRTWWINQIMVMGYYLGVAPQRLAVFYRRQKGLG